MTTLLERVVWRLLVSGLVLIGGWLALYGGSLAKAWVLAAGGRP